MVRPSADLELREVPQRQLAGAQLANMERAWLGRELGEISEFQVSLDAIRRDGLCGRDRTSFP